MGRAGPRDDTLPIKGGGGHKLLSGSETTLLWKRKVAHSCSTATIPVLTNEPISSPPGAPSCTPVAAYNRLVELPKRGGVVRNEGVQGLYCPDALHRVPEPRVKR